jgi:Protein of unknown function (DUF1194)
VPSPRQARTVSTSRATTANEQSATGGYRAFVLPAEIFSTFAQAVRRKLVLKIARLRIHTGTGGWAPLPYRLLGD